MKTRKIVSHFFAHKQRKMRLWLASTAAAKLLQAIKARDVDLVDPVLPVAKAADSRVATVIVVDAAAEVVVDVVVDAATVLALAADKTFKVLHPAELRREGQFLVLSVRAVAARAAATRVAVAFHQAAAILAAVAPAKAAVAIIRALRRRLER